MDTNDENTPYAGFTFDDEDDEDVQEEEPQPSRSVERKNAVPIRT
jgi:hypothetical protein